MAHEYSDIAFFLKLYLIMFQCYIPIGSKF